MQHPTKNFLTRQAHAVAGLLVLVLANGSCSRQQESEVKLPGAESWAALRYCDEGEFVLVEGWMNDAAGVTFGTGERFLILAKPDAVSVIRPVTSGEAVDLSSDYWSNREIAEWTESSIRTVPWGGIREWIEIDRLKRKVTVHQTEHDGSITAYRLGDYAPAPHS